jgi:hypothetical protein
VNSKIRSSRREETHFLRREEIRVSLRRLLRVGKVVGAICLGAGAGVCIGKYLRRHKTIESAMTVFSTNRISGVAVSKTNEQRSATRMSLVAAKLEDDLSMSADVTRWFYWFEALEKAGPEDLPRLVQLAGKNLNLVRLLASRFAELYPRETFDLLVADCRNGNHTLAQEFTWRFFREWTKRDPQAVITALNETRNFGPRDNWRSDVAATIFDVDPELGLKQMWEWHIDHFGPNLEKVEKWATADPRHAAEVTLQFPAGYAAQTVMDAIAKQWAKSDPAGALNFAARSGGELGSRLANTVLLDWAGRDLNGSADWLSHTDASTLNRLAPQFVQAWAKTDAGSALEWTESNLKGSALAEATGGVVRGVAEKDVNKAADMVLALEPSAARAEAALAVAQKWMPRSWGDDPQTTTPPALTNWLRQLDADSMERTLKDITRHGWVETDPKGVAAFLEDPQLQGVPWGAYYQTATALAQRDPSTALAWAERLPGDQRLGAGAVAFSQWQQSQPEPAMGWLNSLPADDPRRQPFFENAVRWMAWETQGAEKIARMSESEQAIARRVIQNMEFRDEEQRAQLLARLGAATSH